MKFIVNMGRKRIEGEMRSPLKNKKRKTNLGKRNDITVIVCLLVIIVVYIVVGLFELLLLSARFCRDIVECKKGQIDLYILVTNYGRQNCLMSNIWA